MLQGTFRKFNEEGSTVEIDCSQGSMKTSQNHWPLATFATIYRSEIIAAIDCLAP